MSKYGDDGDYEWDSPSSRAVVCDGSILKSILGGNWKTETVHE
jgi:hypothetical protein